ncbi:hypothetical protein ABBQ38_007946 [Trebouxia sp. C0009 RCD-2024]
MRPHVRYGCEGAQELALEGAAPSRMPATDVKTGDQVDPQRRASQALQVADLLLGSLTPRARDAKGAVTTRPTTLLVQLITS